MKTAGRKSLGGPVVGDERRGQREKEAGGRVGAQRHTTEKFLVVGSSWCIDFMATPDIELRLFSVLCHYYPMQPPNLRKSLLGAATCVSGSFEE